MSRPRDEVLLKRCSADLTFFFKESKLWENQGEGKRDVGVLLN